MQSKENIQILSILYFHEKKVPVLLKCAEGSCGKIYNKTNKSKSEKEKHISKKKPIKTILHFTF